MNFTQTYVRIRQLAPAFAHITQQAVKQSHNEAEFERLMNNEIERLAKELGVQLLFRQQYTLATGRADAVYNRFVIEYEPSGSLRENLRHGHTAHAVQQVKDYIVGLAKEERHDRDRLLGVAFDGRYFIFVRYHQGHWVVETPLPVNAASCERFLRSLFSLSSGRALIPENLVEDFGNQNLLSHQVTRALYNALAGHHDDLTARLFEQWKLFFGETAGANAAAGKLKHKRELRAFVRGMGLRADEVDMPRFLFALQTYFSFLVKNIARLVLQAYAAGGLGATPLTTIAALESEALRRELRTLESGGLFRTLGIKNLLEGDFFAWYLDAWDEEIETALRQALARLAEYNPVTVQDDPHSARDLLKKLYHYLLPRDIRHDLGEFYTPDWLAERLLTQLGEPLFQMPKPGDRVHTPNKRLLDPACGSGTFLILAARALKANCAQAGLAEADTLEAVLSNLAGIDLNPLAVMAARVNFLLAVADLLPYRRREIEIPIYLADSILTPGRGEGLFAQGRRILETAVGPLPVPEVIDSRAEMERLTDLLEEYVRGGFEADAFLARCRREIPDLQEAPFADEVLTELYETLRGLHREGLDGIWARVLKNAFMPLFLEPFDYVVGNPPWINWESLPQAYRERTAPLWHRYGLFVHSGMDTILGKGKKDASTLMTYAVADRFLQDGGKLAFVITQSVWKTAGAGQGFRRFRIGEKGPYLRVLHVDDLSRLQVFEGASTRTSAWLTARRRALKAVRKVLGPSEYQARAGACTWANAVYWLEVLAERPDGLLVARNVTEGAKRKVESVTVELEPDLVYPLLRGRDVRRWLARPSLHLLMMQDPKTRRGLDERIVQQRYPKTWAYLKRFEGPLRERSGFKRYFTRKDRRTGQVIETGPFYSMFNVGDYTFAPWKVVWPWISREIRAAVVDSLDGKVIVVDNNVTFINLDDLDEALFLAAAINSTPFAFTVRSFYASGGGGIGRPASITKAKVPKFQQHDSVHRKLVGLSRRAHELAPAAYGGDGAARAELAQVEAEIDRAAAHLWGLSDKELADIQASLEELKG